jgi:acetyl-CoA carboxylase carboxyl transferase subunit beta
MRLAHELNLPLVSIIDTAGAALSKEAEEGGLAGEIARSLAELVTLDAPTLCVLLGQGTGGGALAVMPADRVICAQHSWLSPLPPEGASAILHRETSRAPELAASQRVRSLDLLADGIVDRIVAEHPDAADEPEEFCQRMSQSIQHELTTLARMDRQERLQARLDRYRRLGQNPA